MGCKGYMNIIEKMAKEKWKAETKDLVGINIATLLVVLHDKFGFGKERINKLMSYFVSQCESYYKEYRDGNQIDISELYGIVKDELGIDLEELFRKEY